MSLTPARMMKSTIRCHCNTAKLNFLFHFHHYHPLKSVKLVLWTFITTGSFDWNICSEGTMLLGCHAACYRLMLLVLWMWEWITAPYTSEDLTLHIWTHEAPRNLLASKGISEPKSFQLFSIFYCEKRDPPLCGQHNISVWFQRDTLVDFSCLMGIMASQPAFGVIRGSVSAKICWMCVKYAHISSKHKVILT